MQNEINNANISLGTSNNNKKELPKELSPNNLNSNFNKINNESNINQNSYNSLKNDIIKNSNINKKIDKNIYIYNINKSENNAKKEDEKENK